MGDIRLLDTDSIDQGNEVVGDKVIRLKGIGKPLAFGLKLLHAEFISLNVLRNVLVKIPSDEAADHDGGHTPKCDSHQPAKFEGGVVDDKNGS